MSGVGMGLGLTVGGWFEVVFPKRLCDHRFVLINPGTPDLSTENPSGDGKRRRSVLAVDDLDDLVFVNLHQLAAAFFFYPIVLHKLKSIHRS